MPSAIKQLKLWVSFISLFKYQINVRLMCFMLATVIFWCTASLVTVLSKKNSSAQCLKVTKMSHLSFHAKNEQNIWFPCVFDWEICREGFFSLSIFSICTCPMRNSYPKFLFLGMSNVSVDFWHKICKKKACFLVSVTILVKGNC